MIRLGPLGPPPTPPTPPPCIIIIDCRRAGLQARLAAGEEDDDDDEEEEDEEEEDEEDGLEADAAAAAIIIIIDGFWNCCCWNGTCGRIGAGPTIDCGGMANWAGLPPLAASPLIAINMAACGLPLPNLPAAAAELIINASCWYAFIPVKLPLLLLLLLLSDEFDDEIDEEVDEDDGDDGDVDNDKCWPDDEAAGGGFKMSFMKNDDDFFDWLVCLDDWDLL